MTVTVLGVVVSKSPFEKLRVLGPFGGGAMPSQSQSWKASLQRGACANTWEKGPESMSFGCAYYVITWELRGGNTGRVERGVETAGQHTAS